MDELLNEYAEKFKENFPIMAFMGTPDEEIKQKIKNCIDKNKPYIAKYKAGAVY